MHNTLIFVFDMIVAYLVGSICSAVIVSRIFDLPDPRTEGSKNPGATNVLRLAGKHYAMLVLLADMLKGLLPVLLARMIDSGPVITSFTCLAAVLGHMYPVFFGFKGGKGVATAIGAMLALHFMLGVVVIALWLVIANFTRYSSLASIISISVAPFFSLYALGSVDAFVPLLFIALFVLYKHRDNVTRLMDGKETKINFRHKDNKDLIPEIPVVAKPKVVKAVAPKVKQKTLETPKEPKKAKAAAKTGAKKPEKAKKPKAKK